MGRANGKGLDLLGTFEAHLILGVERSRIARFLDDNEDGKDKIPVPDAVLKCGPIWRRERIEERARRMYDEAGQPNGPAGFEGWMIERAVRRAAALPNPLTRDELEAIIGRQVPRDLMPDAALAAA